LLITKPSGAFARVWTSELNPGHAYTAWWVNVDDPSACSTSPCSAPDLIQNEATDSQVTFGDGRVVGKKGRGVFTTHMPAGEIEGWLPDRSFDNTHGAEIHIVLNDHGPVIPSLMPEMIRTYRAGCTDESLPPIFPPPAFADGTPGPNTCRLYQAAVFQQQ
jgi:hypothetical protein